MRSGRLRVPTLGVLLEEISAEQHGWEGICGYNSTGTQSVKHGQKGRAQRLSDSLEDRRVKIEFPGVQKKSG